MNLGTIAVVAEGEYNPLKAYKKLRLVSLEGSSYYTLMATNPGESPISHPEKWMVSGLKGGRGDNANPIFGKATQNNAPDPDPSYKRYNVVEPITTGSGWGIEVTQLELDANRVFFDVENGVVSKFSEPILRGADGENKIEKYVPGNTYQSGQQVITEDGWFGVRDGMTATPTDIPSEDSLVWEQIGGGKDENLENVLEFFLKDLPGGTKPKIVHTFKGTDIEKKIFGISPTEGLLLATNFVEFYAGEKTYELIPIQDIDSIKLDFFRIGGMGAYCNVLGVKDDNSITVLLTATTNNPSGILEHATIDVSIFRYISLYAGSEPEFKIDFIKMVSPPATNAVKTYIDAQSGGVTPINNNVIDLIDYGCVGDGITDDTIKFNEAVLLSLDNGKPIYGRSNTYLVTSISIPGRSIWKKLEIFGDSIPVPTFGTVGVVPEYAVIQKGMRIISNLSNNQRGIIHVEQHSGYYANFSSIFLVLRNMTISSYENPNLTGVHAEFAVQLMIDNVVVDSGIYGVVSAEPTNNTYGVITPLADNSAFTYLRNLVISGYKYGLSVSEHTDGDQIVISNCKKAMIFEFSSHASYFKRVGFYRNTQNICVDGEHVFEIAQANFEYGSNSQYTSTNLWQKTTHELFDPSNLGIGNITYANTKGNVGKVPTFRISGGSGIIVKKVGSETRLSGGGVPD